MSAGYKLKLLSKRLKSGKCQIKFEVTSSVRRGLYGYLLAESDVTLRDVVNTIEEQVKIRDKGDGYFHSHLYNLAQPRCSNDKILIFNN